LIRTGNYYTTEIDNLTYRYDSGNKLLNVADNGTTYSNIKDQGFRDGNANPLTNEYGYDVNGNMTMDLNKGINYINYNHLNLPYYISVMSSFGGGGNMQYVYDATGVKQRKIVYKWAGGVTTTTDYAGNYVYENNVLQFFNHAEGYVKYENGSFNYVYQYKDHLGNVRLSYNDKNSDGIIVASSDPNVTEIVEESNYYPFGLEHKGYNNVTISNGNSTAQKFGYQGQELEEELGKNTLAYQWRDYDPAIGRFNKIDRFALKYESNSPYSFTKNNPIRYREMKGDSIWTSSRVSKNGYTYITTHVRGKVLNLSDRNINMKEYAKQVQKKLGNALYTTDKKNKIRYRSDVQIEAVDSADEVDSSDHLQVIVDNVEGSSAKGGKAGGLGSFNGKTSYVKGGSLFNPTSNEFMTDTGVHEFGHNFGLEHSWEDFLDDTNTGTNYLSYSQDRGGSFSLKQLLLITQNIETLNQGSPTQKAPNSSNNWLYHNSTNSRPYDFNVKKGDIIPTILNNK
jgi:RHS repeat-associated protein